MIREAYLIERATGDVVNKIVIDDQASYAPGPEYALVFEDEGETVFADAFAAYKAREGQ